MGRAQIVCKKSQMDFLSKDSDGNEDEQMTMKDYSLLKDKIFRV